MKFPKVMRSWQSQGSNTQGRNGWSRKLGSWLGKLGEEDNGNRIQRCGVCEATLDTGPKQQESLGFACTSLRSAGMAGIAEGKQGGASSSMAAWHSKDAFGTVAARHRRLASL